MHCQIYPTPTKLNVGDANFAVCKPKKLKTQPQVQAISEAASSASEATASAATIESDVLFYDDINQIIYLQDYQL